MQLKKVRGMQWREALTLGDKPDIGSYGCSVERKDPINLKDNSVGISETSLSLIILDELEEDEHIWELSSAPDSELLVEEEAPAQFNPC